MILDRTNVLIVLAELNMKDINENEIVAWTYASLGAMGVQEKLQ